MPGAKRFVVVFQTVKLALSYIFRRALGYITTVQSVVQRKMKKITITLPTLSCFFQRQIQQSSRELT